MSLETRLNRQMLIEEWNQEKLSNSKIAIIGDNKELVSFFSLSAAALGINNHLIISPELDAFSNIAKQINPDLEVAYINGYFTAKEMKNIIEESQVVVDFSNYNLAKKLLIELSYNYDLPVILSNLENNEIKLFSYHRGKELEELLDVIPKKALPEDKQVDFILSMIATGLALEEVKNILMNRKTSQSLIRYKNYNLQGNLKKEIKDIKALVVGAGALGNFVSLALSYLGIKNIDIMDPDVIEETNLNRQILFYDAVGRSKAITLAERINQLFNTKAKGIEEYFRMETPINKYDVVFDCVDNFETRIVLSEVCKENKKLLISGGTSYNAGQVICYDPKAEMPTPAEFLGLYEIVEKRRIREYTRNRASCSYQPEPSVIMSNQIIGALMVDQFRNWLQGHRLKNIFYDAESDKRLGQHDIENKNKK